METYGNVILMATICIGGKATISNEPMGVTCYDHSDC